MTLAASWVPALIDYYLFFDECSYHLQYIPTSKQCAEIEKNYAATIGQSEETPHAEWQSTKLNGPIIKTLCQDR